MHDRYPDSFCCGPYHEAAILLNVEHKGHEALHCPWMLVDSDRSLIAGREALGFPKKMGDFKFTVTVASSSSSNASKTTTTFEIHDDDFDASKLLQEPGATVAGEVYRGGVKLLSISGRLDQKTEEQEEKTRTTIFPHSRNVFLNIQTNHPLPPDDTDPMCLGNRPRLLQFQFDEIPTDNVWRLNKPAVSIDQTKTDAIGVPFGGSSSTNRRTIGTTTSTTTTPLEAVVEDAYFGVTNFYTGEEGMPALGPTVASGYLEEDAIYWLRYQ